MTNNLNLDASMIANNMQPFEPTHPGELLRDELQARGITQAKLAAQIGMRPSQLSEIINAKRAVNTETALLLEASLNISAELWLKLQAAYNMQKTKSNDSFMSRLSAIRKIAAAL